MKGDILLCLIEAEDCPHPYYSPMKTCVRGGKVHARFTSAVGGHLIIPAILTPSARSRDITWLRRRKLCDPYLVRVVFVVYKVALVEVFLQSYFYLSVFFHHYCVNRIPFTW